VIVVVVLVRVVASPETLNVVIAPNTLIAVGGAGGGGGVGSGF
jgi:hypothetical protein